MSNMIYDGSGAVFGRLSSVVAKSLLKGNSVDIINCEKMIVSGDKNIVAKKIMDKRKMGSGSSLKGPKYPRAADRLVKRMIRGMLPWNSARGQDAFKRLRCYVGNNKEEGANIIKVEHKKPMKFATIKDIVELM
jgi:large subunit ribosomal protein L13